MKALIISNLTKRFQPGHFTMIKPLQELGYEVHWAANFLEYKDDINQAPIKAFHIDFIRNPFHPTNFKAYLQLMRLLKKERYDVVHCNSPIGGVLGRLCGRQAKVPTIIYTAHGFHFYKGAPLINRTIFKWAEMWMARYTDVIITINQEDYQAAQKFKLRKYGKVCYIPGVGIDTSFIKEAKPKREEIANQIGANKDSLLLISIGELNKNKNNEVIIKALGKLKNPNIHYLLCGIGDRKSELYSLSKECGLEKNVRFLGYRTDIPELLKSCDIFVMPSYREGLSRSLMEAMSAGLPCIVSKIRGNIDLIKDGRGGFLHEPYDVDELASSLKRLIENQKLRTDMGKFNLEKVKEFDVENVKREIYSIYCDILKRSVISEGVF